MHHILASHYGLTHQQVMALHGRGYSYEDIAIAANIAARSGRPLTDVVTLRDQRMEWPAIASQYGIPAAEIERPSDRVAGTRATMGAAPMSGRMDYSKPNTNINWSRRFELTPLEMKRLRAMGLRDREVFVIANAARLSGRPVDSLAQRVLRGQTTEQIAMDLNLPVSALENVDPMWRTPEWEQAVREGHWSMPSKAMMQPASMR
jgi:hypothetical protein